MPPGCQPGGMEGTPHSEKNEAEVSHAFLLPRGRLPVSPAGRGPATAPRRGMAPIKKETGGCLRRPPGNTFVSAGRQAESPTLVGRMQVGLVAPAMMTGAVGVTFFRLAKECFICMGGDLAGAMP